MKEFLKKIILKKKSADDNKDVKIASMQRDKETLTIRHNKCLRFFI